MYILFSCPSARHEDCILPLLSTENIMNCSFQGISRITDKITGGCKQITLKDKVLTLEET